MDDWCAGVTRKLYRNAQESPLPFVIFIFVANYILLNIMLAISCDQMKEVSHQQRIFDGECDSISSFSIKSLDLREFTIKHSLQTIHSNLMKLIEFNHSYFFSKLKDEHKTKEIEKHKIITNKQNETEFYYFLNGINKPEYEKKKFELIFEYQGKKIGLKNWKTLIKINQNVEIILNSRNLNFAEKQKKIIRNEISDLIHSISPRLHISDDKINDDDLENEMENLIK